jgi:hypothetical protein
MQASDKKKTREKRVPPPSPDPSFPRPEGAGIHLSNKFSGRSSLVRVRFSQCQVFLLLGICLILLFIYGEEVEWIWLLHGDEGDKYDVSNFLGMKTCRIRFMNGDIKAEMMLPS